MFYNQVNETYYLYDCQNESWICRFNSKRELIDYLFFRCIPNMYGVHSDKESIFSQINMNGKDKYTFFSCWIMGTDNWTRRYLIEDQDYRIVDIRTWDIDGILEDLIKNPIKRKNKWNRINSNHKKCYGHYYSPHYIQRYAESKNPETKYWIRGKIREDVLKYFGGCKLARAEKSWKSQTKDRYQWEHNLKRKK